MKSAKLLKLSLLFVSAVYVATAQNTEQQQKPQKSTKKDDNLAKHYREQEPLFKPPPLPVQRKLQVFSGAEQPPSFFQDKHVKAESRQFQVQPTEQQFTNFNTDFQQSSFQQSNDNNQFQQRQQVEPNQFQQFNQQPTQQQSFQANQDQSFQNFQDSNNFQSRQQEALPTLPPVFIPPNNPVGPPPQLQSPIRNLFRQPEPSFSLAGLLQRFLRLFNLGDN